MRLPVQITFREIAPSAAIDAYARERVAKLDRSHGRIIRCRVVVDVPHRHHRQGARYGVRIEMTVPGGEVVVSRARADQAHTDVYACIDAAFDDAQRLLKAYAQRRRGDVKRHRVAA